MSDAVKSAGRAFAVLELFERRRCPLALTEVAGALALPTSSAAALLKTLVTLGYLEYDRSHRRYSPTMRIAELGRWVEGAIFGDGAVLDTARALNTETGLTAMIAVQSDLHAQYLHLVHPGDVLGAAATPGARRPLASSGMGLALLSGLRDAAVARLVRRINHAAPADQRVDLRALRVTLHEVRQTGYAFSEGLFSPGIASIAVLIPGALGSRPLALGMSGPSETLVARRTEVARRLLDARATLIARG